MSEHRNKHGRVSAGLAVGALLVAGVSGSLLGLPGCSPPPDPSAPGASAAAKPATPPTTTASSTATPTPPPTAPLNPPPT